MVQEVLANVSNLWATLEGIQNSSEAVESKIVVTSDATAEAVNKTAEVRKFWSMVTQPLLFSTRVVWLPRLYQVIVMLTGTLGSGPAGGNAP